MDSITVSAPPLRLRADSVASDSSSLTDMTSNPDTAIEPISCRFLELPAEIRTIIYELLLKVDGQITLTPRRRAVTTDANARAKLAVNILRTNEQIHEEAGQVLYGSNIFAGTGANLETFCDMIGVSKQHLRRIYITSVERNRNGSNWTFKKLRQVQKLRLIAIGPTVSRSRTATWLAEASRDFVFDNYRRLSKHETKDCLDMFKIIPWGVSSDDLEQEEDRIQQYREQFRAKLDGMLRKQFNISSRSGGIQIPGATVDGNTIAGTDSRQNGFKKHLGNKDMGHFRGRHFVPKKAK